MGPTRQPSTLFPSSSSSDLSLRRLPPPSDRDEFSRRIHLPSNQSVLSSEELVVLAESVCEREATRSGAATLSSAMAGLLWAVASAGGMRAGAGVPRSRKVARGC